MNHSNKPSFDNRTLALAFATTLLPALALSTPAGAAETKPDTASSVIVKAPEKIQLSAPRANIAQAFLQRRHEAEAASAIAPPEETRPEEAPAKTAKVDPQVAQAVSIEPVTPSSARAAALLSVAREMALEARTAGDFTEVIEQCHRALDAHPDRRTAEALARLGAWAYNRRGEQQVRSREREAFDDFQEAILLDPNCWEAIHNRAITLARYDKLDQALADFNRVIELEPSFALARYNRAETYSQMRKWKEAIDEYTAVAPLLPEEAMVYAGRAHARHQGGDAAGAIEDYDHALRLDGSSARALVGRAMIWAEQGQFDQAAADFRDSLKVAPPTDATYRAVAWFLATCPDPQHRDGAKAIEAANRALALSGANDPGTLDVLAAAHASAGDFKQAVEYQQRAVLLVAANEKGEYQYRLELYQQEQPYIAPVVTEE